MRVKSYAKINLALDIVSKPRDKNGYHHIRTVFQQIQLHDILTFKKSAHNKITLICNNPAVPLDQKNTIIKALVLLKKEAHKAKKTNHICGLTIQLQKNIPVAGGLGGGSSNAAAALMAGNKMWRLNFSRHKLTKIAAQVGMDVPFFLQGGTALGTHYGEKIKALPSPQKNSLLLLKNDTKKSTKRMYRALQSHPTNRNSHQTQQFLKKIQSRSKRNMASFSHFFHNDLELILNKKYIDLKKKLLEYGANYVGMSGAGPTVFAIFKDRKKQKKAYQILKKRVSFITQTSTIP